MTLFHSVESIFSVYILIALGYLLTRKGIFDSALGGQFAWLIINITFPAYVIAALPDQFTSAKIAEAFWGIATAFAATVALYPIGFLAARLLKVDNNRRGVFVAMIVFSNVVFIGLPVNIALFGDRSVEFVLQYYMANTIIFWTVGIYFLQNGASSGIKPKINIKRIALNPPILATALAIVFVLLDIKVPFVIKNSFQMLGYMTTPLATLFMGIVFSEIKLKDFKVSPDIIAVMLGRFAVAPAIIWALLTFTSFPQLMKEVFIIQAAMPIMNQVTISSRYYGADYKYSTIVTVWSFIMSMFVIPIYVMAFG